MDMRTYSYFVLFARSLTNSIVFFHNDFSLISSGKEIYEFWKFCGHDEATMFSNCFGLIISSKLLYNNDFSSIGGSEKGGYEAESGNEYCENCGQCG